jgi:hypothetical protein
MGQPITREETIDLIKYANIAMGIYVTQDQTDLRLLVNYTFDALQAMGATKDEGMAALAVIQNTKADLPRNLSAHFFSTAIGNMRAKARAKHQTEQAERETTNEEKDQYVEEYYNAYKIGGATWQHWSAGSAWIARHLELDIDPFMNRAAAKVKQDVTDDGLAKGLRTFVANLEPNKVQSEAGRMAVQAHFRQRYDKEKPGSLNQGLPGTIDPKDTP